MRRVEHAIDIWDLTGLDRRRNGACGRAAGRRVLLKQVAAGMWCAVGRFGKHTPAAQVT
jgi:hypothetical protein